MVVGDIQGIDFVTIVVGESCLWTLKGVLEGKRSGVWLR